MTEVTDLQLAEIYYGAAGKELFNPLHTSKLRAVWEAAQQACRDELLPEDNQILARLNIVVETDDGGLEEAPYDYLVEREPVIVEHNLTPYVLGWLGSDEDVEDLWADTTYTLSQQLNKIAAEFVAAQRDGV